MGAYTAAVLADAPVHYWRLADPGGSLCHDIGSAPRALNTVGQGLFLPYLGPVSDGGAAYVGQNQAINYQDGDLVIGDPVTLECWFWLQSIRSVAQGFLALTNGAINLEIGLDATYHPQARTSGGTRTSLAAVSTQHWHHLVLTDTLVLCSLYLDAFLVASGAGGVFAASGLGFIVGAGASPSAPARFATAALAECAIYPTALAAGRVTAHFVAADNILTRPVFKANGTFDVTTGLATGDTSNILAIQKDVVTTYKNAP